MKTLEPKAARQTVVSLRRGKTPLPAADAPAALAQRTQIREVLRGPRIQAKLVVGQPDDPLEREADRVADEVLLMPEPGASVPPRSLREEIQGRAGKEDGEAEIRRQPPEDAEEEEGKIRRQPVEAAAADASTKPPAIGEGEERETLRRQAGGVDEEEPLPTEVQPGPLPHVTPDLETRIRALKGGGQSLSGSERRFFEPRFGRDLSAVRVHTGPEAGVLARRLNARAFTHRQDLFFGTGQYAPESRQGLRLIAHELAHVAQGPAYRLRNPVSQAQAAGGTQDGEIAETECAKSGGDLVSRAPVNDPPGKSDPVSGFEETVWSRVLAHLRTSELNPGSPYATWLPKQGTELGEPFFLDLDLALSDTGWKRFSQLIAAAQGRAYRPEDPWGEDVVAELRMLFVPMLTKSLGRIVPQYVAASYLAMKEQIARNPGATYGSRTIYGTPEGSVEVPVLYPQVKPDPSALVPSEPLDVPVIRALCGNKDDSNFLEVDYERYEKEGEAQYAKAQIKKLRPIKQLSWVAEGALCWVRISDPYQPTVEEVSNELYGDPSQSQTIIDAAPLFYFDPRRLTAKYYKAWYGAAKKTDPSGTALIVEHGLAGHEMFKHQLLKKESSESWAMNEAAGLEPTGETPGNIVRRLSINGHLVDTIAETMGSIHIGFDNADLLKSRLKARAKEVGTAGNIEKNWLDAHSQAQFEILRDVAAAVSAAADDYQKIAPNSHAVAPVRDLVAAYLQAANFSDLVVSAQQLLAKAKEKQRTYPFEYLRGTLEDSREQIASVKAERGIGAETIETPFEKEELPRVEGEHGEVRKRLYSDYEAALRRPKEARQLAQGLKEPVAMMKAQTSMAVVLDQLETLWEFMLRHQSDIAGLIIGKRQAYERAMDSINESRLGLQKIFVAFKIYPVLSSAQGLDKEFNLARRREAIPEFEAWALRESPRVENLIDETALLIEEKEKLQQWVSFAGKILATIALAFVSAGLGAFARGLLGRAGLMAMRFGTIGTTAVATGVEQLASTAVQHVLEEEPASGFLASFLKNWALFGALDLVTRGLRGIEELELMRTSGVSAEAAKGLAKGAPVTTAILAWTPTLAETAKALMIKGRSMDELKPAILEQLCVHIGTVLVDRYAGGRRFVEWLEKLGKGSKFFERLKLPAKTTAIDAARSQASKAAEKLKVGKRPEDVLEALRKDAEALQKELDFLEEAEAEARKYYAAHREDPIAMVFDLAKLSALRSLFETVLASREANIRSFRRAELLDQLQPIGGTVYECKPGTALEDEVKGFKALGDVIEEGGDELGVPFAKITLGDSKRIIRIVGARGPVAPAAEVKALAAHIEEIRIKGPRPSPKGILGQLIAMTRQQLEVEISLRKDKDKLYRWDEKVAGLCGVSREQMRSNLEPLLRDTKEPMTIEAYQASVLIAAKGLNHCFVVLRFTTRPPLLVDLTLAQFRKEIDTVLQRGIASELRIVDTLLNESVIELTDQSADVIASILGREATPEARERFSKDLSNGRNYIYTVRFKGEIVYTPSMDPTQLEHLAPAVREKLFSLRLSTGKKPIEGSKFADFTKDEVVEFMELIRDEFEFVNDLPESEGHIATNILYRLFLDFNESF